MRVLGTTRWDDSVANTSVCDRSGFTIIELVVSIAVIGLLFAISVPAVQQSREAVRAMGCRNYLKQISLAAQNYEATWNALPPNISLALLDQLEQPAMAREYSLHGRQAAITLQNLPMPVFECPSDSNSMTANLMSYGLNQGWGIHRSETLFTPRHPREYSDYTDGLSSTAYISEVIITKRTHPATWPIPLPSNLYAIDERQAVRSCGDAAIATTYDSRFGTNRPWPVALTAYFHGVRPNRPPCFCPGPKVPWWTRTASSMHPHGVMLAFADGHVSFIAEQIDLDVWEHIGTWNQADAVSQTY